MSDANDLGSEPVEARSGTGEAEASSVVTLQRSLSRWRVATWVVGTAALALLFVAIGDRMVPSANLRQFVAVLSANSTPPAFIATIALDSQTLVVRRLGDAPPPDRSYELWAVPAGEAPQSLGVIQQARYATDLALSPANLTLAVSLEPQGGSRTGAPTGPIVFTGQLIAGN